MWLENKGKTLHLLKQASKPVPQQKKRVKRTIYEEPPEEVKREESEAELLAQKQQYSLRAGPNIIGNAGEMPSNSAFNAMAAQPAKEKADETMFVPVDPRRTTAQDQYRM